MSIDRNKPTDPTEDRVDLDDPQAVQRWTQALGVNEAQLRHAVRGAGNNIDAIRSYLHQGNQQG